MCGMRLIRTIHYFYLKESLVSYQIHPSFNFCCWKKDVVLCNGQQGRLGCLYELRRFHIATNVSSEALNARRELPKELKAFVQFQYSLLPTTNSVHIGKPFLGNKTNSSTIWHSLALIGTMTCQFVSETVKSCHPAINWPKTVNWKFKKKSRHSSKKKLC